MPEPDPSLDQLMARMAAGELAALWAFHEAYRSRLRGVVLANVRSMHRYDIVHDPDRVEALTADVAMVVFERASGWRPGGALPWTWAARAIRHTIAAEIGHRSVELAHDDLLEGEVADAPAGADHLTFEAATELDPRFRPFADAYTRVGSVRDQAAAWLFRVQKINGDPSPAHTVADEFGITPANARKIHERHFGRVRELVWADEQYEALRTWRWFAA